MIVARSEWPAIREKLGALFLATFGRAIQPGYLDWRYLDNGQEQLLFSVEMENLDPVASYSAFPVNLVRDGRVYRTAMSMTTMTHPRWQGRGLFQKLATELYAYAQGFGTAAVWGFPNATSHPHFHSKLGWSDIYEIPTMALDLADVAPRKLPSSEVVVEADDAFSMDYPEPPRDGLTRVHRPKEYLAWRYARNPENAYRNYVLSREGIVSSYVVTKAFRDGVDLVDIQTSTPEEARLLLSHVVKLSRESGLRQAYCWAPTHHAVHGVLEWLGFENSTPVTYFGGRELIRSAAPGDWLNFRNWYLQMGDSDVY